MATKIYLRRGLNSELTAVVLESGEPGWTTDEKRLYIGDGSTAGGILVGGDGVGVDTLNALYGAVTISGGTGIAITVSGQYIIVDEEAGGLDVDSLNGLTGVVTISGGTGISVTISGQTLVIDEEAGGADVDSLNGLIGVVTISGVGTVSISEDGQQIVVSGQDVTDVDSINSLTGEVTVQGAGLVTVTEEGQVIVVSGEDPDDVSSLNGLIDAVTISGAGVVTVSEDGQVIVVSGEDIVDVDSLNALTGVVTISGTGTVHVSEDGQNIVISGQDNPVGVYWDDLRTPINMLKQSPDRPPVWAAYKGSYVMAFEDQAVNVQSVYWAWQLPHTYQLGTDVVVHIHTVPEDTTSGSVYWDFTYATANTNELFPTETTVSSIQPMPEIADKHTYHNLATVVGSGITSVSTMLLCSLTRRSDLAEDTFDSKSVYLLEVDMHYRANSFGSIDEWDK
jgi:hypothetical protein